MLVEYPPVIVWSRTIAETNETVRNETVNLCSQARITHKKNYKPTHSLSMAFWFAALSHLLLYPTKKAHFSIQQSLFLKKDQSLLGKDDLEREKYLP